MISGTKETFLNKERISIIIITWTQLNKNIDSIFSIKSEILKILIKKNEVKEIKIKSGITFNKLINISKEMFIRNLIKIIILVNKLKI